MLEQDQESLDWLNQLRSGDHAKNRSLFLKQLQEHPEWVNRSNEVGETVLMWAIAKNEFDMIQPLIEAGADVNHQDQSGETALMMATLPLKRKKETVQLLLKAGANVNLQNEKGETVLMIAAKQGNQSLVEQLCEAGADEAIKDHQNKTALDWVSEKNHDLFNYLKAYQLERELFKTLQESSRKRGLKKESQQSVINLNHVKRL